MHFLSIVKDRVLSLIGREDGAVGFEHLLVIGGVSVAIVLAAATLALATPGVVCGVQAAFNHDVCGAARVDGNGVLIGNVAEGVCGLPDPWAHLTPPAVGGCASLPVFNDPSQNGTAANAIGQACTAPLLLMAMALKFS